MSIPLSTPFVEIAVVEIVPFKGLLFDQEKTGPLENVSAPPYDVISPKDQEALHARHPYNVVRLILGQESADDTETDNRYTRSAKIFQQWTEDGILSRDPHPSYYVYSQNYSFQGKERRRIGFFAQVKLEDFSTGNICPHEFTLAKAKKDRSLLIQACRANFSPIFGLFSDPEGAIDSQLTAATVELPLAVIDDGKVIHRLWRFEDPDSLKAISESFKTKTITIADGHHRYETALGYHKEQGKDLAGSSHVMMFLTNLDSESMSIFPIHRMIKTPTPFDAENFLTDVGKFFQVEPLEPGLSNETIQSTLQQLNNRSSGFCVYLGQGKSCLLKINQPENILPLLDKDEPEELQVLDVAQLHVVAIRSILNIDTKNSAHQQYVTYTVNIQEAMERVDKGAFDLAFLMNPTPIDQVRSLAEKGIRLPQKATFFYPKLLSGLVINTLES